MTEHERFREMLARRAELAPQDETALQLHLAGCPECRETAEAYSRQTVLLRALPVAEAPPALRAGVLSTIRRPRPIPFWRRPVFALAPLSGALLAAVIAVALLTRPHSTSNHNAGGSFATPTPTSIARDLGVPRKPTSVPAPAPVKRHAKAPPRAVPSPTPVVSGSGNQSGEVALGVPPTSVEQAQNSSSTSSSAPSFGPISPRATQRNQASSVRQPQAGGPSRSACCKGSSQGSTPAARPTAVPQAPQPPSPAPAPTTASTPVRTSPIAPTRKSPPPTGNPAAPPVPTIPPPGQGTGVSADAGKATPVPTPSTGPSVMNAAAPAAPISTPVPPPAPVQP